MGRSCRGDWHPTMQQRQRPTRPRHRWFRPDHTTLRRRVRRRRTRRFHNRRVPGTTWPVAPTRATPVPQRPPGPTRRHQRAQRPSNPTIRCDHHDPGRPMPRRRRRSRASSLCIRCRHAKAPSRGSQFLLRDHTVLVLEILNCTHQRVLTDASASGFGQPRRNSFAGLSSAALHHTGKLGVERDAESLHGHGRILLMVLPSRQVDPGR